MKPVAYILRNEYDEYRLEPMDDFDIKTMPVEVEIPLVPKRNPLTDDEIELLWTKLPEVCDVKDYARAVEAAHGIKG